MLKDYGKRWPPVHDEDDLAKAIQNAQRGIGKTFYELTLVDGWCQGDIIKLDGAMPVVDESGEATIRDFPTNHWMLLGNSCDLTRELDDVQWTTAVPLLSVDRLGLELESAKTYTTARVFFVPSWDEQGDFYCDLTLTASISRQWLNEQQPVARLRQASWTLLNACLVRYLARNDGRND